MREVIEEAATALSQICKERHIALELQLPENPPPVVVDRDRVMQVMLNLLSNATNFCDKPDSRVCMALAELPDALQIDVSDNGIGISPADQAVIFEKFRQVSDTPAGKPRGSGLGLAISREIIEHFGGRLWVDSAPGAGSRFSFTLPLQQRQPAMLAA
jgi:signal transduction histidine kinase